MGKNIQIQLVDDHPIVRTGCRHFLEKHGYTNIIESTCGHKAIHHYTRYQPDIVIMDLIMPGMDGMSTMQQILADFPDAKVIILSMADSSVISGALKAGAKGILSKGSVNSELITAIEAVQQGNPYIDTTLAQDIALKKLTPNINQLSSLTKREKQLLLPLLQGDSMIQIAFDLRISPKTARVHKSNLMRKLGTQNMVELTQVGIKEGLIRI